jgi:Flp pilus assembly protein TadG
MAYDDGVKTAPIAFIGLMSVLVLVIIVLLLQVFFFGETESMLAADKAQQGRPAELADLTAKQQTTLTAQDVVDRDRGVVRIGISRAMELVTTELAAGKTPAEVQGPALPAAAPPAVTTPDATVPVAPEAAEPPPSIVPDNTASPATPTPDVAPPAETSPVEEKK